jgi:hypothetical protein
LHRESIESKEYQEGEKGLKHMSNTRGKGEKIPQYSTTFFQTHIRTHVVDKAVVIFKHPQSKIANKKLIHRKLEACIHTQSTQHTNNKAQKLTKIKYRGMCSRHHTKHTNNKAKKSHPEKNNIKAHIPLSTNQPTSPNASTPACLPSLAMPQPPYL